MDIYFDKNYGRLYEKLEDGVAECLRFECDYGVICSQFIKREIPIKVAGKTFYDLVTPYGYGGPVIVECNGSETYLVSAFENWMRIYASKNNIVSEFVRFHPITKNGIDFKQMYSSECIRHTVGTNLKDYDNPVQEEFSKSCRKRIRRAIRDGITYKITEKPENLHSFKEIYYSTMDRNEAGDYYYFSDDYFTQCLNSFRDNIILVEAIYHEKVIAAGFYFVWDKTIHIHLSGTLSEYLYLSPAYILRYAVTLWGKEHGYELIHHGGGRSNAEDDSLYTFKKQFGEHTAFDFYVGRKIWNESVYEELCRIKGVSKDIDYFPAYRGED